MEYTIPEGALLTGLSIFDDLFGPFTRGDIHLLVGRTDLTYSLMDRLIVNTARKGEAAYYIDGGHRADPFAMARVLRMQRTDPREMLRKVMIARAFTAYQMDSLINGSLKELSETPPLLMISALDRMFSDPEVETEAAKGMIANCMETLDTMASRGSCVVIAAYGGSRGSDLMPLITPHCSNWVSIRNRQKGRIRLIVKGGRWTDIAPIHPYQTMIDDFWSGRALTEAV
jgi:hypothetical protein